MTHTLLRTSITLSLTAMVMFSCISPVMAKGKDTAPGQLKKNSQSVNQTTSMPELPSQASQVAKDKLAEVKQGNVNNIQATKTTHSSHKQLAQNTTQSNNSNNQHPDMHCTNHNASGVVKVGSSSTITVSGQTVKVVISGATVAFKNSNNQPIEVEYCLKASTNNTGKRIGSTGKIDFLNNGGQIPGISYVVVYRVVSTPTPTPTVNPTPTPEDNGQTLSTNTSKPGTGVMGTSIERGGLPNTGGAGLEVAKAFGLFLIVLGACMSYVGRIQGKIAAQMSV